MRILVVEDEHRIANTIKKGLELEKYSVDVCYDGSEAYDLISSESYAVIVLDIMLPGISGVEICKKMRRDRNHTPVLMLTAKGLVQDKVLGLDAGADDYLTKPFAFEELVARVRALTRRPVGVVDEVLKIKDLSLNLTTYEVKIGDKPVRLSGKEYSILEYLMRHPNQILSKDRIMEHVWSYEADVLPNTLEVNIRNIRRKIGDNLIETIRGFGYKITTNV